MWNFNLPYFGLLKKLIILKHKKMEKTCEFCTALRPVVYCKADAACLCLLCDAMVHSANLLSYRHPRTVLCDSCRHRPANAQCLDHHMFMCRVCDKRLHNISSQHQKQTNRSYIGCPSAKDFAALWGFSLNELDSTKHQDQFVLSACGSSDSSVVNFDISVKSSQIGEPAISTNCQTDLVSVAQPQSKVGSSSQQCKIFRRDLYQQNRCFILSQILDLKKLQLNEQINPSPLIRGEEKVNMLSLMHHTGNKLDEDLEQPVKHPQDLGFDFQQMSFPFSQLEYSLSSSTAGLPPHEESFWQCRSPVQSSQLWSQNIQDLGVCEELVSRDDFDIPDVDLTFRNFEDLFRGDQDPIRALLHDKDVSFSFTEGDMSLDKSENARSQAMEDASVDSSFYFNNASDTNKDIGHTEVGDPQTSIDDPLQIRPCHSTLSFSMSMFSAESTGTDCLDSGHSPYITGGEPPSHSLDLEARENAKMIYKEKKKSRLHDKHIRYSKSESQSRSTEESEGAFCEDRRI